MASIWSLHLLHPFSLQHRIAVNVLDLRKVDMGFDCGCFSSNNNRRKKKKIFIKRFSFCALSDEGNGVDDGFIKSEEDKVVFDTRNPVVRLQKSICSHPSLVFLRTRSSATNIGIGLFLAAILVIVVKVYAARKSRSSRPGSVADLVRRGQLRSDRRGISSSEKYEDPFNNPMVKVGKTNSTIEMCGKVYRLAPVTLTREQQSVHQQRRSRAYQWKRPTIFLKEGDAMPPDVDPDTVRWIPANHPFATTVSDIDEDLAQNNVHQKHGVPFRIQAEHEALQRKLESLQIDQKFNNMVIDPGAAKNFERPFKSQLKSDDQIEEKPANGQVGCRPTQSDRARNSFGNYEEIQQP